MKFDGITRIAFAALGEIFHKLARACIVVADRAMKTAGYFARLAGAARQRACPKPCVNRISRYLERADDFRCTKTHRRRM